MWPARAGLDAVRDLDRQTVGMEEVVCGDADPPRRDLLDRRPARIAVHVELEAMWLFAALAGVRSRTQAVHADRERLVRLGADRAERHRARDEPPHDLRRLLDLV